jgi:hypothetical protein
MMKSDKEKRKKKEAGSIGFCSKKRVSLGFVDGLVDGFVDEDGVQRPKSSIQPKRQRRELETRSIPPSNLGSWHPVYPETGFFVTSDSTFA